MAQAANVRYYVLTSGVPLLEPDLVRWYDWREQYAADCLIARTALDKGIVVVTEFLGIERPGSPAPPKLYQTTVQGGTANGMMRAYATAADARRGHDAMVAVVRKYHLGQSEEPPA